jgi:type I restriction enzyme S subunit
MNWKKVKLGDVLIYEQPTKYIVKSDIYNESYSIPVLTAGKSFILGYTNETDGIFTKLPVIIFDDFTTSSKFVDFKFKVKSSAMKILKAKENLADIKFMYYLLQMLNIDSEQHKRYWISKFSNLEVLLPPLTTQRKIVEIIEISENLIKNDQLLVNIYDELAKSIFVEMFGDPVTNEMNWPKSTLKSVTSKIGSGATPTGGKASYKSSGISLIRSMNIYDFEFKWKDLAYIDTRQAKKLNNVEVLKNDVLFNITGASVCRCSIVPNDVLPARVNQHVAILRAKSEKLNHIFLNHLLVSDRVKANLLKIGSSGGAVMEAITKEKLENFEIILPPIEIQNKFEKAINFVFEAKINQNETLAYSMQLFDSLTQKAFSGELVA